MGDFTAQFYYRVKPTAADVEKFLYANIVMLINAVHDKNLKLDDLEGSFDAAKTIVTNAMSEIQGYINSGLSTE